MVVRRVDVGRAVEPCYLLTFPASRECSGPPVRAQAARLDARSLEIFGACPRCPTCPTKIIKRYKERRERLSVPAEIRRKGLPPLKPPNEVLLPVPDRLAWLDATRSLKGLVMVRERRAARVECHEVDIQGPVLIPRVLKSPDAR